MRSAADWPSKPTRTILVLTGAACGPLFFFPGRAVDSSRARLLVGKGFPCFAAGVGVLSGVADYVKAGWDFRRYFMCQLYFPIQNWLKMESSKSSVVVLPTISPTALTAMRSSPAASSNVSPARNTSSVRMLYRRARLSRRSCRRRMARMNQRI
jgi:hypothetical protein